MSNWFAVEGADFFCFEVWVSRLKVGNLTLNSMRCNVLIPRLKTAHGIHWDSLGRIGQIAGSLPEIPFLGSVTIRSERVACPCPTK